MKFLHIAKKDLKILFKDKSAITVLFILPIMFISVMSFALQSVFNGGSNTGVSIQVVNHDKGKESDKFIAALGKVEGIDIVMQTDDNTLAEEKARNLVDSGKYPMALIIPSDFSSKVTVSEEVNLVSYEDPAQSNMTSVISKAIEGVSQFFTAEFTISYLVDDQVKVIRETFDTRIAEVRANYESQMSEQMAALSKEIGRDVVIPASTSETTQTGTVDYDAIKEELTQKATESMGTSNIIVNTAFNNQEQEIHPDAFQQNVPGYTVMFAFFIVMFAGRSFINERNEGTFQRILTAPIDKFHLFLGKMIPNFVIGLMQTVVMFTFGHFVFGMSLGHSILGLVLISICMIWSSTALGMMVASLVKSESQVTGFSMLIVLTLAALGGTMVPLFVMPDIMQKIALITPHAWALNGYQNLLVRGMGLTEVWTNALALLAFGFTFISISIWRMHFDD